jgi:hypothetical protein
MLINKLLLISILLFSSNNYSQYKSDFIIADSASRPFFDFDYNGNIHMVWQNGQKSDRSIQYSSLDYEGNFIYQPRKISNTIHAADPKLAINKDLVACVWEDKVALDLTIFSTFIKGKILKNGQDFSDELQIDDEHGDAYRGGPEIIWHSDSALYAVWSGDGSLSPTEYSDIYMHKLLFPPFQKAYPYDEVINNPFVKVVEGLPKVVKQSSGQGYFVIWIEKDSLSILKIAGVNCDNNLLPVSPKVDLVNFDSVKYFMGEPAVFKLNNGNIILAWAKDTLNFAYSNIYFQEFTEQGLPVSEVKKVNDTYASEYSDVSADIDSAGNFIIIWEVWPDLFAQRFSPDMNKMGANFKINTLESDGNSFHHVRLKNGKIYTMWNRLKNGNLSVWMNILDFKNPTMIQQENIFSPQSYSLSNNYPNPFNPSTTISYQIKEGGLVTLKIYDILGSEVATLINEEIPVGKYELSFNGSELPSGVYIYQLQVNDFSSSKKLVLLK